jgi:hypothetical protein
VTHCIIMTSISVLYLKDLKERNIMRHKPSFGGEGGGALACLRDNPKMRTYDPGWIFGHPGRYDDA